MIKKLVLLSALVLAPIVLTGCSGESITIRHNTPATSYANIAKDGQKPKSVVKKSSGIIIYKDVSSNSEADSSGKINFGPKDVNFDLPVKMK